MLKLVQCTQNIATLKYDLHLHLTGLTYKFCTLSCYGKHLSKTSLQSMKEIWNGHKKLADIGTDGQRDDVIRVFRRAHKD